MKFLKQHIRGKESDARYLDGLNPDEIGTPIWCVGASLDDYVVVE